MTALEIVTEPLGGSRLTRALLAGAAPSEWLARPPADVAGWRASADAVRQRFTAERRAALVAAFREPGRLPDRVRRALRDGVVVTTGQQPGLFGGPLYTWHKAMSALALADELETALGIPVAPVFWAATDDTDWREAASTVVAVPGGFRRLALAGSPTEGIPLADVALGDVTTLVDELAAGSGSALHAEYLEIVRQCYRPPATVGGAYVELLRTVLEPLGVGVLDANHATVREMVDPLLRRALRAAGDIARELTARSDAIRAAGFEPQVALVNDRSLVFEYRGGAKRRVPLDAAGGTATDAARGMLSPNVLLRPVAERALLPTVAYVAGPAEIAYFAQSSVVADALGMERPVAIPRWSGTIIEPHIRRILDRHQVTLEALGVPHLAERTLAGAALPPEARSTLDAWAAAMREQASKMAGVVERTGVMPPAVVEGAERAIGHRLERLERRLLAAAKRRAVDAMKDLATARGALLPDGKRQERALNAIPLLARHGADVLAGIRAAASTHARALLTSGRGAAVG